MRRSLVINQMGSSISRELCLILVVAGIYLASLLLTSPAAAIGCGDGICNPNAVPPENVRTCPNDCGGPPDGCLRDTCDNGSCSRPAARIDRDRDSVPDRLEYDLAHKFFPSVLMKWADIDRNESYLYANRATPYTVKPYTSNFGTLCNEFAECLEIRWAIAFFWDNGDPDLPPLVRGGHLGDSEMYAALLRRTTSWSEAQADPAAWVMIRDFTAAHWGEHLAESSKVGIYSYCPEPCGNLANNALACAISSACRPSGTCTGASSSTCGAGHDQSSCLPQNGCTWTPGCAQRFAWSCYERSPRSTHAVIYSSEGKHALYHTEGECDGGGVLNADDCPNNKYNLRDYKVGKLQNVGNADAHGAFDTSMQHPSRCGLYNVWVDRPFGGATSYFAHFTAALNWALPLTQETIP